MQVTVQWKSQCTINTGNYSHGRDALQITPPKSILKITIITQLLGQNMCLMLPKGNQTNEVHYSKKVNQTKPK